MHTLTCGQLSSSSLRAGCTCSHHSWSAAESRLRHELCPERPCVLAGIAGRLYLLPCPVHRAHHLPGLSPDHPLRAGCPRPDKLCITPSPSSCAVPGPFIAGGLSPSSQAVHRTVTIFPGCPQTIHCGWAVPVLTVCASYSHHLPRLSPDHPVRAGCTRPAES